MHWRRRRCRSGQQAITVTTTSTILAMLIRRATLTHRITPTRRDTSMRRLMDTTDTTALTIGARGATMEVHTRASGPDALASVLIAESVIVRRSLRSDPAPVQVGQPRVWPVSAAADGFLVRDPQESIGRRLRWGGPSCRM